jgi:signal transduction histidine kinase
MNGSNGAAATAPVTPEVVSVLLVEDNPGDARLIREALAEPGSHRHHVDWVERLAPALDRLAGGGVDVVLLDLTLPDSSGLGTLSAVTTAAPEVPVVVLTGLDDQDADTAALQGGAQDYLVKRWMEPEVLSRSIRLAMERHRLRREFEALQAERLETRGRFLSHVSHELRTPLTAIYQFACLIRDGLGGPVTEEQLDYASVIIRNSRALSDMIGDLLEATRAETGKLTISAHPVPLRRVIDEAVRTMEGSATAKGLTLTADVPDDLPYVVADPGRIGQVVRNLIDNAVKFTARGGSVELSCRADGEEVEVSVADTGAGISAEGVERIFDRLHQESGFTDAGRAGLGLGLYLCREIVHGHGGRIWVESELGAGSMFRFTLPVAQVEVWSASPNGAVLHGAVDAPDDADDTEAPASEAIT